MKSFVSILVLCIIVQLTYAQNIKNNTGQTKQIWLDDLAIQTFSEGIRPVSAKSNYSHDSMRIKGVYYDRGIGAQSPCVLVFSLNKNATAHSGRQNDPYPHNSPFDSCFGIKNGSLSYSYVHQKQADFL